jgi:hypothetical protein
MEKGPIQKETSMRAILALTIVGAVAASSSVAAMAQQTPKQTPSTPQQTPSAPPANQIDSARTADEKSLVEFWTPERLRNARPMPTPRVDPNEVKK